MSLQYWQWNSGLNRYEKKYNRVDITCQPNRIRIYEDEKRKVQPQPVESSQYIGVCFVTKQAHPWRARIKINGTMSIIGHYDTDKEAAHAYDKMAAKLGRKTNFLKKIA